MNFHHGLLGGDFSRLLSGTEKKERLKLAMGCGRQAVPLCLPRSTGRESRRA